MKERPFKPDNLIPFETEKDPELPKLGGMDKILASCGLRSIEGGKHSTFFEIANRQDILLREMPFATLKINSFFELDDTEKARIEIGTGNSDEEYHEQINRLVAKYDAQKKKMDEAGIHPTELATSYAKTRKTWEDLQKTVCFEIPDFNLLVYKSPETGNQIVAAIVERIHGQNVCFIELDVENLKPLDTFMSELLQYLLDLMKTPEDREYMVNYLRLDQFMYGHRLQKNGKLKDHKDGFFFIDIEPGVETDFFSAIYHLQILSDEIKRKVEIFKRDNGNSPALNKTKSTVSELIDFISTAQKNGEHNPLILLSTKNETGGDEHEQIQATLENLQHLLESLK
jgi:hypothetical protein